MPVAGRFRRAQFCLLAAGALVATTLVPSTSADARETAKASQLCREMTAPIYKSVSPRSRATLLTPWRNESSKAASRYGFTSQRSKPFEVSHRQHAGLVPVYRLYSPRANDFLWTTSVAEVRSSVIQHGYQSAGVDFYAADHPATCTTSVYRYVKSGVHRYATSAAERKSLARGGWKYEQIIFYARAATSHATPKPSAVDAGPLSQSFYLNKSTGAWNAYVNETNATRKNLLYQIAATPTAIWLGGRSSEASRVRTIMNQAQASHTTPQFVLYAIPHRDCGSYSAGGLNTVGQYEAWVDSIKRAIAGNKAVVIVEPDAIGMSCLSSSQKADRFAMLKYAMSTMSSDNVWVYLHAGSAGLDVRGVATNLKKAGISTARGFAVDVSSFDSTASEIAYGKAVVKALGMNKHFVIDTSRNGLGRYSGSSGGAPSWCNPPGRALGTRPTTKTADPAVDAYLWIKPPGDSDGKCRTGDPSAGGWFGSYALDLVQRSLQHKTVARLDPH